MFFNIVCNILERTSGIEPPSQPWQGCIIATIRRPHYKLWINGKARRSSTRSEDWCRGTGSDRRRMPLPKQLDYLILHSANWRNKQMEIGRWCGIIVGTHPLVSTPSSLLWYPARLGSGLSLTYVLDVPRIHPIFQSQLPGKAPKNPGHRSTTELPRHYL